MRAFRKKSVLSTSLPTKSKAIYSLGKTVGSAENPPLAEQGPAAVEVAVLVDGEDEGPCLRLTVLAPHNTQNGIVEGLIDLMLPAGDPVVSAGPGLWVPSAALDPGTACVRHLVRALRDHGARGGAGAKAREREVRTHGAVVRHVDQCRLWLLAIWPCNFCMSIVNRNGSGLNLWLFLYKLITEDRIQVSRNSVHKMWFYAEFWVWEVTRFNIVCVKLKIGHFGE